jgi:glutamate N-acetyltransferase/amino-acid N-acetyltransferase
VTVSGAPTQETARQSAKAVVGSNLVKAAVFGADPNWGRILCAIGYGAPLIDPASVDVKIGEIPVVKNGLPVPFDEEAAQSVLSRDMVKFHVDLHQGEFEATAWGCDLTYEYVRINACYRT